MAPSGGQTARGQRLLFFDLIFARSTLQPSWMWALLVAAVYCCPWKCTRLVVTASFLASHHGCSTVPRHGSVGKGMGSDGTKARSNGHAIGRLKGVASEIGARQRGQDLSPHALERALGWRRALTARHFSQHTARKWLTVHGRTHGVRIDV